LHRVVFSPREASRIARHLRIAVLPGGRNSGQKAQMGPQKKKLSERICGPILAEFYQKVSDKGPQKIFKRSSLFLAMITTYNVHQDEIKFDF
jgi:hypothetical protein